MIVADAPDLLVTAIGIAPVGTVSLLNPKAPGLIKIVCDPVVMTSAITPALGVGSVPSNLEESAVLLASSVYNLTQAACVTEIFINKYDLNPLIAKFPVAPSAIDPVSPVIDTLLARVPTTPVLVQDHAPEPSVVNTCPVVPSVLGNVHVTLDATVLGAWKAT